MIHAVAVLAFKAVYTLEVTRRENDRRILALYTEYVVQPLSAVRCPISRSHRWQDERYDGGPYSVSLSHLLWFVTQSDYAPCRLKDVKDATKVAPDGQTIKGRMQGLCVDVAGDIKKCANACDTYLKSVGFYLYRSR